MASFGELAAQLRSCAQSQDEIGAFVGAFAKVRIRRIMRLLGQPDVPAWPTVPKVDWSDSHKLAESGLDEAPAEKKPWRRHLHIDVALQADQGLVTRYLTMTGVSEKQSRVVFPVLSSSGARKDPANRDALAQDVARANEWLSWVREHEFDAERFLAYQRNLNIHGNSQNLSGAIGHVGAVCAFLDALEEVAPGAVVDMEGEHVDADTRSPDQILEWIDTGGKVPRAALLRNGRAIAFPSDPDVAIFTSIAGKRFKTAKAARKAYDEVRRQPEARRQMLHEFVVGEVKTATDPANLHERLALGARETRDEVRVDRFLMMSVLTRETLQGGTGTQSGRTLENRDVVRFSDVFNLHFAWGWDGGRVQHASHWERFKARVKTWCGV